MATILSIANASCTSLASQKSTKSVRSVHSVHISNKSKSLLKKPRRINPKSIESPPHAPCDGMTPSREPHSKYIDNSKDALFQSGADRPVPNALSHAAYTCQTNSGYLKKQGDEDSDSDEDKEGRTGTRVRNIAERRRIMTRRYEEIPILGMGEFLSGNGEAIIGRDGNGYRNNRSLAGEVWEITRDLLGMAGRGIWSAVARR